MKLVGIIFLFLVVLVALIAGYFWIITSPPLFPDTIIRQFVSKDGKVIVTLENVERSLVGDETYIRLWVQDGGYRSDTHVIDQNGRLKYSEDYFLDISKDRNWVRTCKPIKQIQTGRLVWVPYEPELMPRYEKWMRGHWEVMEMRRAQGGRDFSFRCDAFVNYKSNLMIRMIFPNSTREQRESNLFAPKETSDMEDQIDGKRVIWERLVEKIQRFQR